MAVRMSNNMIAYNYLTALNNAAYKLNKQVEQMASEKKLNRPSDSPVDSVLDLRYKVSLTENEQYSKNLDSAMSWMETTYDCMTGVNEKILQRVKELTIQAATDVNNELNFEAIAEEIDALINQLVQTANTTIGDRYIFAGQNDRGAEPFKLNPGAGPNGEDIVEYFGDDNKISMVINPGSATPSQDSVNLTGYAVFGPFEDALGNPAGIFADLIELRDALKTQTPPNPPGGDLVGWLSGDALGKVNANIDKVLEAQTSISAKVSMYNLGKDILSASNVRINENISQVEDLDVATAAIAFTIAQNAYNAALSMGAKILPMSLVDFLR